VHVKGLDTPIAVPQSSTFFGQVTTSRRKHGHNGGLQPQEGGRNSRPDRKPGAEKQGQGNELSSQLQRLQLLQREAQDLLQ
jgi:hypothetical protein